LEGFSNYALFLYNLFWKSRKLVVDLIENWKNKKLN